MTHSAKPSITMQHWSVAIVALFVLSVITLSFNVNFHTSRQSPCFRAENALLSFPSDSTNSNTTVTLSLSVNQSVTHSHSVKLSDLLIGVVTGVNNVSASRKLGIDRTWLPDALAGGAKVMMFAEAPSETPYSQQKIIDVSSDPITFINGTRRTSWLYIDAPFKFYAAIARMLDYAHTHMNSTYPFYFLSDDDSMVFPYCIINRINEFLKNSFDYTQPLWFGQRCGQPGPVTYCGGAGLLVNHAAMLLLNRSLPACLPPPPRDEKSILLAHLFGDVAISKCLQDVNVSLINVDWMRSQPPLWYYTREGRREYPQHRGALSACTLHYNSRERMLELISDNLFSSADFYEMTYDEHKNAMLYLH